MNPCLIGRTVRAFRPCGWHCACTCRLPLESQLDRQAHLCQHQVAAQPQHCCNLRLESKAEQSHGATLRKAHHNHLHIMQPGLRGVCTGGGPQTIFGMAGMTAGEVSKDGRNSGSSQVMGTAWQPKQPHPLLWDA